MARSVKFSSAAAKDAFLKLLAETAFEKARDEIMSDSAEEEMRQVALARDLRNFGRDSLPASQDEAGEEQPVKKPAEEPKKVAPKKEPAPDEPADPSGADKHVSPPSPDTQVTFTMIKDKLNTIRSGRSLRDKDIKQEFRDYFESLDEEEQAALYAFLDGISQVLSVGLEGEEADAPAKDPHNIKMDREKPEGEQQVSSDRNAQASVKGTTRSRSSSGEDTTPPIQVGAKQRTESVKKRMRELMG